jgi:hypothetical protein
MCKFFLHTCENFSCLIKRTAVKNVLYNILRLPLHQRTEAKILVFPWGQNQFLGVESTVVSMPKNVLLFCCTVAHTKLIFIKEGNSILL